MVAALMIRTCSQIQVNRWQYTLIGACAIGDFGALALDGLAQIKEDYHQTFKTTGMNIIKMLGCKAMI